MKIENLKFMILVNTWANFFLVALFTDYNWDVIFLTQQKNPLFAFSFPNIKEDIMTDSKNAAQTVASTFGSTKLTLAMQRDFGC